jgi:DNA helicase HerA-like ATPase
VGVKIAIWAAGLPEVARATALQLAHQLREAFASPDGNCLVPLGEPAPVAAPESAAAPVFALSPSEVAALLHLPAHPRVARGISRRVEARAAVVSPPPSSDLTVLGEAERGDGAARFGLTPAERRQHLYVVGKTGTGKSTLLARIAGQDLAAGRGHALIDPHGDLAETVLGLVPPGRQAEVVYFDPADPAYAVGFNPLLTGGADRALTASGTVSVFKKLYGESWGPRLEHFLRYSLLALLETPSPSLVPLPRLLTDRSFRREVLTYVSDPLVRGFFAEEFERYDPRWQREASAPILNKVGALLAAPAVRHTVGQVAPPLDLRRLMDRGGILIANLATGRIGEDNAGLLGGLLVTGFQLAAMSRATLPEAERRPFYLLVDEFQNFATESFAQALSEARKYGLALTLSHQYLDQLPKAVSDAVFGNAATLVAFRVGQQDTARLAREFQPVFDGQDLVHLDNFRCCVRLSREGTVQPAFSARSLPLDLPAVGAEHGPSVFAIPRAAAELDAADLWEGRLL